MKEVGRWYLTVTSKTMILNTDGGGSKRMRLYIKNEGGRTMVLNRSDGGRVMVLNSNTLR